MKFKLERDYQVGIDLEVEVNRKKSNGKSSKDREELRKIFSGEDFNF